VTVLPDGNGSGSITSEPPGLSCTVTNGVRGGVCTYTFRWSQLRENLIVRVRVRSGPNSLVTRYGERAGVYDETSLKLTSDSAPRPPDWAFILELNTVRVTRSGGGTGRVTSAPTGIECGTICTAQFAATTKLTLTAKPDPGAVFKGWTGACAGDGPTCKLTVAAAIETNAVFDRQATTSPPPPAPTPPPPAPAADRRLAATLLGVEMARGKLGERLVRVRLDAGEKLAVVLAVRRQGRLLATRRLGAVPKGVRLLTLVVPKRVTAGRATISIRLTDRAGNTKSLTRSRTIAPAR